MELSLGKGIFLVATPGLRDPNFRQTVVLLCEHGPEGALGVIVNRPTEISITEILPHIPVLEGQSHVVYSGGPVQQNHLLVLYRVSYEPEDTHHVFDGVYLGGNTQVLADIIQDPSSTEQFKAFIGYAGWAPGQLENEMKMGSWLTVPADTMSMFERSHHKLWADILASFGPSYEMYAHMPLDPNMN